MSDCWSKVWLMPKLNLRSSLPNFRESWTHHHSLASFHSLRQVLIEKEKMQCNNINWLIWFGLQKSLPYLRHSLATRELEIKGILPPALSSVPVMAIQQQQQQNIAINRVTPVPIQGNRPTVATATMVRGQTPGSIVNASTSSSPAPRPTKVQPVSKAPPKQPNKILQQPIQQQQTSRLGIIKTENNSSTETPPISFTITLPQATTTSSSSASIGATATTTPSLSRPALSTAAPNVNAAIKGSIVSKEKKAANFSSSLVGLSGDDDINDVAAMGGVNLAEETQQILGSTEMIGTQIRSCKDENFLFTGPLLRKIQEIGNSSSRNELILSLSFYIFGDHINYLTIDCSFLKV